MIIRRILYTLLIGVAFLFYLFDTGYLAWIFLAALICAPPVSLCFSLLVALTATWECTGDREQAHAGTGFAITVRMKTWLPLFHAYTQVCFTNAFDGCALKRKLSFSPRQDMSATVGYHQAGCGVVRCTLDRPRLVDITGLFALPMRRAAPVLILVWPDEIPFSGVIPEPSPRPTLGQEAPARPRLTPTRETSDIRPYQEGDSIRDIHWKLSARADKLIVREYQQNSHENYLLLLLWTGDAADLALALGRLRGLLSAFASQGRPHWALAVCPSSEANGAPSLHWLLNQEDLASLLWQKLSESAPKDAGLDPEAVLNDTDILAWPVILVEPQGACLCDGGIRRETLI